MPVLPGYDGADQDPGLLQREAARIGFPIMVKAAAGGGGRGMRLVRDAGELAAALASAEAEAAAAFGDARLLLERAVVGARHVEIQVFADAQGRTIHLGERDCSVQRRHQKIIEEAPSPAVAPALRRRMGDAAVAVARAVGYVGAGTVEFLLDADGAFWFIEMNTRLQVEHAVTEALLGIDLVEWQLRVAAGEALPLTQDEALARYEAGGHAIEARLCAEDPGDGYLPQSGRIVRWSAPPLVRCDHALAARRRGQPLLRLDARQADRACDPTAPRPLEQLAEALDRTVCLGVADESRLPGDACCVIPASPPGRRHRFPGDAVPGRRRAPRAAPSAPRSPRRRGRGPAAARAPVAALARLVVVAGRGLHACRSSSAARRDAGS